MLEIGDKVKIRPRLKVGKYYGGVFFAEGMGIYRGKETTIKKVEGISYRLDIDDLAWNWSEEMFEEKKFNVGDYVKITKENMQVRKAWLGKIAKVVDPDDSDNIGVEFDFKIDGHSCGGKGKDGYCWYISKNCLKKVEKEVEKETIDLEQMSFEKIDKLAQSIDKLSKEIHNEDPFKQAMLEGIIEKGKELATEDLKKEIKEELDKFIQETYGNIPKKIRIERNGKHKDIDGIFHKDFEKICKIVESNIPLMLVGGAGAGKNYTLEQVAQALDLTFYTTNAVNQDYKLTGFIDANGKYHETEFYKAFTKGGMFFLDEIDASCPEALVTLNSAIANKYFDFPTGRVTAHKDFRVVCAGNTYGTGADMVYVGRNVLDGATLDRFVVLEFDYDEEVEKQLAYDNDLFKFIRDLRQAINKAGLRYIVSMRALINSTKLLEIGIDKQSILRTTIVKNMQKDDLNTVINKLEITDSDWFKEIKRLCD